MGDQESSTSVVSAEVTLIDAHSQESEEVEKQISQK